MDPMHAKAKDQPKKLLSWPGIQPFLLAHEANTTTARPPDNPPTNKTKAFVLISETYRVISGPQHKKYNNVRATLHKAARNDMVKKNWVATMNEGTRYPRI
ncbi:hypothetical protein GWI33_018726 [Rhynchophorus ferrugineus]|uniref:Uncharacterized protein n=1 Tax=Rhynchophorus ferrugineus TaxID=354439 RepID=A0A834HZP5_RHYFE|nr:hypothetical protein GWI33_018726 [Rhynchophorus ferrugineus]